MTSFATRLAMILAATAWILGLVLLARWQGWPVGLGAGLGGVLVAIVLAEEWEPTEKKPNDLQRSNGWPGRPRSPVPEREPVDFDLEDA